MSISSISPGAQPLPSVHQTQNPLQSKKNDGDGDEVNGVDPANEKTNEGAKGTTQPALASTNPGAGKTLNLFA